MNKSKNIIIAKFYSEPNFDKYDSEKQDFVIKSLNYNNSWDAIMPVVEKIESLGIGDNGYEWYENGIKRKNFEGFSVEIENNRCMIYANLALDPIDVYNKKTLKTYPTKLEAVYEAVVEFILEYEKIMK